MKVHIKRLALAFLVYAIVFVAIISVLGKITPEETNGFFAFFIIICCFGIPGVAAFFSLHLYDKQKFKWLEKPIDEEAKSDLSIEKAILEARAEEVTQKEANLEKRKNEFDAYLSEKSRELNDAKLRADCAQAAARQEIAKNQQAIEELQKHQAALIKTERRLFSWAKSREEDELSTFNEIREKAEKYLTYSEIAPDMDGFKFEEYISKILEENGYNDVTVTQKSRDFGADVTASLNGIKYVFQCKYYTAPVGISAVQEVYSAKSIYSAHVAVVVTNSVYTKAAQILADEVGVILWDGEKLSQLTAKS